jgi:hypothetical protein
VAFVRCEDPSTGHQFTLSEKAAKSLGLKILDRPAVDGTGRVLPAKPRTTKGGVPKKSAGKPAPSKES